MVMPVAEPGTPELEITCTPAALPIIALSKDKAGDLDNTVVINISKDLPFALERFCAAEGLDHVTNLSDFRGNFGTDYQVELSDSPMKGLLSRAVIVTDENNKILYTEQVPEIAQEPDYDKALNAAIEFPTRP